MEFLSHRLDNGLEIIAEYNPRAHSVALGYFVQAGSRDETRANSGVSHFLEHMTFKGTPRRQAEDVNRELDEIGSRSNAYTTEEQTVYYAAVLPEYQDRAVDLLSDIMRPSLRAEDFETEKQVILEEIAKYDDQPPFGAYEKAMAAHFGEHSLGQSILGTVETVSELTQAQMMEYFQQRYSPGNMLLTACGKVDFPALVRAVEKHCGSWVQYDAPRDLTRPKTRCSREHYDKELAMQHYVLQLADAPDASDPRRFAVRLLDVIVGDDSGSRLFWELIDSGCAEYAALGPHEFQGAGLALTYLCCSPDATGRNLERIEDVFRQVERDGVGEEELQRAKNKVCSSIVIGAERPSNRLFSVGGSWLQRRQYQTLRDEVAAYRNTSLRELHEVLEAFPLTRRSIVSVGPNMSASA